MKLVARQEDLALGLGAAGRAAAVRTTMPALTGIYLQADDEGLTVRGTNLEMGIEWQVPASVERTGSIVLPARHLTEMIRRVPQGAVEIDVNPDTLKAEISWGRSEFMILGFSPLDYPPFPQPAAFGGLPFSQTALKKVIRQTAFCTSDDPTRPSLMGVSMEFSDNKVTAVSSDGYRIAIKESQLVPADDQQAEHDAAEEAGAGFALADDGGMSSTGGDSPFGGRELIIPSSSLNELARSLDDRVGSGGVLYLVEREACFDLGSVSFNARLIQGQFPNVLGVLPRQYVTTIEVDVEEAVAACERVLLVAQSQERTLAATIKVERDSLTITCSQPDLGHAYEEIAASVEGELLTVHFNPRFLVEGLRHQEGERCLLELSGAETPSRMRVEDRDFSYVVMPIKMGTR